MTFPYGYFSPDGSEFIVTNPATPRPFDNFLWNDSLFANVQQTGVGYLDYQIGDTEAVQLYTGVGRICDFDVFGRDHLMNRLIYVRDNETGEFWNINWEPVRKSYDAFEAVHGLGYTILRTTVDGIAAEFRIFVPIGKDPVEIWTLRFQNRSNRPRNLSVFTYNQFQFKYKCGFDSYGDMIFRGSWFNSELNAVVASKHPFRKPHDYLTGFMTADYPMAAFDGSRDAFVGTYNSLKDPQALLRGSCSNTPGCSDATIAAGQFNFSLEPQARQEFSLLIGATDREEKIADFRRAYFGNIETHFQTLRAEKSALLNRNRITTPDAQMDRLLNGWVKQATLFGATWCRWGYNGYRDIVQHGLGVASLQPERTREILLQAFRHQYSSGLALRGWNPIDEKPYSDSALWLVFTLVTYLKETGDFQLLEETAPFYDEGSASVLSHVERALDFLESNKGAHELCLIKFGDWNDSLTGVGKEGRGESIWLSQAYAEAMREMADLMERLERPGKAKEYRTRRTEILNAINRHAWDGEWYTRCFNDAGQPIGSQENRFARIFMEPQSWALICGAADDERAGQLIAACDRLLGTPHGYQLLSPAFTEFDETIGRISSLEPGVCENGTIYSHLNIWMILGLLRYNMADKAYEVFRKISPGYIDGPEDRKGNCPPYMYANCYYGPAHRNNSFQMEFTWITGSVAWFNTVIINEMLGVKPTYNGLQIDPCLPSGWKEVKVTRNYRGCNYEITLRNPDGRNHGDVRLMVNGQPVEGSVLPIGVPGAVFEVEATIA